MSRAKKLVLTSVCAALCVVLPTIFHMVPGGGAIFLPMHIPVLLCGMICGGSAGFLCGLTGPLLSHMITAMPPAGVLPAMMAECAVYGLVSGLLLKHLPGKKPYVKLYISLMTAMVLGRIVSGILKALIFSPGISFSAWFTASFVTALPGIAIQLLVLPPLVQLLKKANII